MRNSIKYRFRALKAAARRQRALTAAVRRDALSLLLHDAPRRRNGLTVRKTVALLQWGRRETWNDPPGSLCNALRAVRAMQRAGLLREVGRRLYWTGRAVHL